MESSKYDVVVNEGHDWFCFLKQPDESSSIFFFQYISKSPDSSFGAEYGELKERIQLMLQAYPEVEYRLFRFSDGELVSGQEV